MKQSASHNNTDPKEVLTLTHGFSRGTGTSDLLRNNPFKGFTLKFAKRNWDNDYSLNIALYVDTTEPEEDIDVTDELKKLRELQEEREEIEQTMNEHMEGLGYE